MANELVSGEFVHAESAAGRGGDLGVASEAASPVADGHGSNRYPILGFERGKLDGKVAERGAFGFSG